MLLPGAGIYMVRGGGSFLPAGWLSFTLLLGCSWPRGALSGLFPDSTGKWLPSLGPHP